MRGSCLFFFFFYTMCICIDLLFNCIIKFYVCIIIQPQFTLHLHDQSSASFVQVEFELYLWVCWIITFKIAKFLNLWQNYIKTCCNFQSQRNFYFHCSYLRMHMFVCETFRKIYLVNQFNFKCLLFVHEISYAQIYFIEN